jgi:hypothetical protein
MEIAGVLEQYLRIHRFRLMVDDPATGLKEVAVQDLARGFHQALLIGVVGEKAGPVAVPSERVDDRKMSVAGDTPPEMGRPTSWATKPLDTALPLDKDFLLGNLGGTVRGEFVVGLYRSCFLTPLGSFFLPRVVSVAIGEKPKRPPIPGMSSSESESASGGPRISRAKIKIRELS